MPISFEIPDKNTQNGTKDLKIHYIPAKIEGDGKADVSNYFENYTERVPSSGNTEILTNAFRGFPLKGCEFELPEGKIGAIFRDPQTSKSDNTNRALKFAGTFKSFTYWNYDVNPSENDSLRKTISALDVMEAVHKKV